MLNPTNDRLDYGQILAPPADYYIDFAIGTTYSLNLDALVGASLALGLSAETDSDLMNNPVCLLEALRSTGDNVALFCEGGQIHLPNRPTALYILLEKMVFSVKTPKHRGLSSFPSFHPKFWLIRYKNEEDDVIYRIIILSRNLTFDRSWDVSYCMDGVVKGRKLRKNQPVCDFLQYLLTQVPRDENGKEKPTNIRSHFAVAFTKGDGKEKATDRKKVLRNAFNSPFRPFVLATTSIGQEGLDFHNYCRKIVHWNLPSNPIDLEQREGRINRFECMAIRQNVAKRYGDIRFESDIWDEMFEEAARVEKTDGASDLIPYWGLKETDDMVKIERIVPMYPYSRDGLAYERLIKILSLYRLTLGQARQEELLEYLFKNVEDPDKLKELFINLSPYYKEPGDYDVGERPQMIVEEEETELERRRLLPADDRIPAGAKLHQAAAPLE